MKNFKNKDLTTFIRYGGLNLKKQKGYGKSNYHSPPTSKGIYAFPLCAFEYFLIGAIDKYQSEIFPKEKKPNRYDEERENKINKIVSLIRKSFKKKDGYVWHHLEEYCKHKDIIDTHNSWVKTDMETWRKAIVKASLIQRYYYDNKSVNNSKLFGYYSKDHFEVYFDEKV
ncbi:MAG TPA: hypothetical protein PKD00_03290 [Burkholderiales bacterium]|nr:hypothetical protein [Burkholderiales bacterium]